MLKFPGWKIALGFATIYIVWGSTYLAIRLGVETIPPFIMAGIRFLVGGLCLYGWARIRGATRPKRSHWWPALALGILMPLGGTGLVTWAETTVPSGLTALLVAVTPMWIVLVDWRRPGGVRPNNWVIMGLLLGFTGITMLVNPGNHGGFREIDLFGAFLIVVATMSWACGSIYSKHAHQPESKVLGAGMQMAMGGVGLIVISVFTGEFAVVDIAAISPLSWLSLAYLTTVGSVSFAVYVWLLSATSPSKVATYAYVNPIIALALGSFLAGEQISAWTLGCSVIVISAVVMIITTRARKRNHKPTGELPIGCEPIACRWGR